MLDIGILGVGHIGAVHLQSANALETVEVTAVADQVAGNRRRAQKIAGCQTYTGYEDLLRQEDIDIAVIALPPFLHADAACAAAAEGAHVFVEKPLARSTAEADDILSVAADSGVQVGVDHTIRYHPEIQEIKAEYDAGHLGHVPMGTITRINSGPLGQPPVEDQPAGWKLDPELTGGGALMDLGVHLFDVVEHFFGEMTVKHATIDHQLNLPYEDTVNVVLRSKQAGTSVNLLCGYYQWEYPPDVTMSFELHGIAESIDSRTYVPDNFTLHAGRSMLENVKSRLTGESPEMFGPTYYYTAHYHALKDFIEAIVAGETPPVSGETGRRCIELAEITYEKSGYSHDA